MGEQFAVEVSDLSSRLPTLNELRRISLSKDAAVMARAKTAPISAELWERP